MGSAPLVWTCLSGERYRSRSVPTALRYGTASLVGVVCCSHRTNARARMGTQIVLETHAVSEDNERGIATGWQHGQLSARGRLLAAELGARRQQDGIQAVFTSDLRRAVETATRAFADMPVPILCDWRLRECDYGAWNGGRAAEVHHDRGRYLDGAYPGGESWRQAIARVGRFLPDLHLRWAGARVLVIGHVATRWAFDHLLNGVALEVLLAEDFGWREGWEYRTR